MRGKDVESKRYSVNHRNRLCGEMKSWPESSKSEKVGLRHGRKEETITREKIRDEKIIEDERR